MPNELRPGAYINVTGNQTLTVQASTRGTVSIPLALDWGPEDKFISIESSSDCYNKLGYKLSDPKMLVIKEALKNALCVKVFRTNSGTKASATDSQGEITLTAKFNGSVGNNLAVVLTSNQGKYDVTVTLNSEIMEVFNVTSIDEISSDYVTFSGILKEATLVLSGGSSASTENFTNFFDKLKVENTDVVAYTGSTSSVRNELVEFIKSQRDDEYNKIVGVYADTKNDADHEGIIVVANGVVLSDGTVIDKYLACAWVGGATAGAQVTDSCTFKEYQGAVDVDTKFTNSQIENYIKKGMFLFSTHGSKIVAEYDINSLVSYTKDKPEDFHKNKVIRVLDAIANDVKSMYEEHFIGKVQNNEEGRNLLKGYLCEYMKALQVQGAVVNFKPSDIVINIGRNKESVVINLAVTPTDTIDKIYMSVEVE